MPPIRLTAIESSIARWAEDSTPFPSPPEGTRYPVRAAVLRSLILQQPVLLDQPLDGQPDQPRTIAVGPSGLKFRYLRITDGRSIVDGVEDVSQPCGPDAILDLDDACGPYGASLPPLELVSCLFPQPVRMRQARFRRLSLENSTLISLEAADLLVEGPLNLSDIFSSERHNLYVPPTDGPALTGVTWEQVPGARRPAVTNIRPTSPNTEAPSPPAQQAEPAEPTPAQLRTSVEPPPNPSPDAPEATPAAPEPEPADSPTQASGLCWIDLSGAHIRGNLRASGTALATSPTPGSRALQAIGCHIEGQVYLNQGFVAFGGVNFASSRIDLDFFATSATIVGIDTDALALTGTTIGGDAFFQVTEIQHSFKPFVAIGTVDMVGATIGGGLWMSCSELLKNHSGDGGLMANGLTVGGSVYLTALGTNLTEPLLHGPLTPFFSAGSLDLMYARIGGDLKLAGACILTSVHGTAAINLYGASIAGDLEAFPYWAIGSEHFAPYPFVTDGTISFPHATFGKNVNFDGAVLEAIKPQNGSLLAAMDARSANISGYFSLESYTQKNLPDLLAVASQHLYLDSIQIGGDLTLSYVASLPPKPTSDWSGIAHFAYEEGDLKKLAQIGSDEAAKATQQLDLLNLNHGRINGKLTVSLSFPEAAQPSTPDTPTNIPFRIILDNLKVGELDDANGQGWGAGTTLSLRNFTSSVAPLRQSSTQLREIMNGARRARGGGRMPYNNTPRWIIWLLRLAGWLGTPFLELACFFRPNRAHIHWLRLQYAEPKLPQEAEFTPSAYDNLARLLRAEGYDTEAKTITSAKLRVQTRLDVLFLRRWIMYAYGFCFDYGLSAFRALGTFAFFIALGTFAVVSANRLGVLVLSTSTVNTVAYDQGDNPRQVVAGLPVVGLQHDPSKPHTEEIPCGARIEPVLYSLESFVPALNLDQTRTCVLSNHPAFFWWRVGRAAFAILGWLITSITLLTIPGILRSRAEG